MFNKKYLFVTLAVLAVLVVAQSNAAIPGEPVNCPATLQTTETLCNGLDDTCSGRIDELDPVPANACVTGLKGACAKGFAQCHPLTGAKVCTGPKPQPETFDGIDNDCDGVVDNIPTITTAKPSKVAIFQADGIAPISTNTYEMILDQRGIRYDILAGNYQIDLAISTLITKYSLILIPGGVTSAFLTTIRRAKLEQFVSSGGVVFYFLPDGSSVSNSFAGLSAATARADISYIRFVSTASAPIMASLDTTEELNLYINGFTTGADAIARYTYTFTPLSSTTVLANSFTGATGNTQKGASITRRVIGSGSIYTFGHDMYWYVSYRCYINCFDPSIDVLGLMIRDGLVEGTKGHAVFKHTVPGPEDSILFMTTDTHDYFDTVSGMVETVGQIDPPPRISFFSRTSTDQLTPSVISYMCAWGQCPIGGHTVSHPVGFKSIPTGTGTESIATGYRGTVDQTAPGTNLNGEIRVNQEIVYRATGQKMRTFRSPWLELHTDQYPLLEKLGIVASSSLAIGDLKSNLPVDLRKYERLQDIFKYSNIREFPLSAEDGIVDANKVRYDLQPLNYKWFLGRWKYIQLQNKRNNAMTVILDHDGWGAGPRNEAIVNAKKQAMIESFNFAKANDIKYNMGIEEYTDWWNNRNAAVVDATFTTSQGYVGTIKTGKTVTIDFTLQFGDEIGQFVCASCGAFTYAQKRIIISKLNANATLSFTAKPGKAPKPTTTRVPTPTATAKTTAAPKPTTSTIPCKPLVVNNFDIGVLTLNTLGFVMGDEKSMNSTTIYDGKFEVVAKEGAYWYTTLTPTDGYCLNATKYAAVTISIKAPVGAQIMLGLQTKNKTCGARDQTYAVQLANYAAAAGGFSPSTARILTIPFQDFGPIDLTKLGVIAITNIFPTNAFLVIDDIGLVDWSCGKPANVSSGNGSGNSGNNPTTCQTVVVDSFDDSEVHYNNLALLSDDDGTMSSFTVTTLGRLMMTTKATGSYYYTLVANNGQCRNLTLYSALQFSVNAPTGTNMTLEIHTQGESNCSGTKSVYSRVLSGTSYFTGNPKTVSIPLSSFAGLVRSNVVAIAFSNITGNTTFSLDDITFSC